MANVNITSSVIVQESLRILHNRSAFLGKINTDYQSEFGKAGEKVGSTINIRKPPMFTVRSGPVANIQDVTETSIPLTIQPEFGVDFSFSDFDLALTIDRFSERYIRPAAARLATELDLRIAQAMVAATYNAVGTPGTPPATQVDAQRLFLDAGVKLTNNAADRTERFMVLSPSASVNTVANLNLGFNSQSKIGKQYETGQLGNSTLGWDFSESQNMPVVTVGPLGGTPLVNGANQGVINTGSTDNPSATSGTLITDGWTAAAAQRLKAGDVFTIAGVFQVNPETKQTTGQLQQFTVVANASSDGAGNLTLTHTPPIIAGGAFQNVSARPADNAAITVLGTANTAYPVSLGFTRDSFTLATVPLDMPKGMDMAEQAEADGVSLRFVRGFDITNNRRICRFDIMAGYAGVRPEWGVRVYAG